MFIRIKNLTHQATISNKKKKLILNNLSFDIPYNKITLIIGRTGSGKTILCQHLNALMLPTSGECVISNLQLNSLNSLKIMSQFSYIFQNPAHQLFLKNVFDDISYSLKEAKKPISFIKNKIYETAELLGLDEEILKKNIYSISDSEKKKVAIAGALVSNKPSIIFDEPLWGFNYNEKNKFINLIYELKTIYHKNIFIISHNLENIIDITDYLLVMENGKNVFFGSKAEFCSNPIALEFLSEQMHDVRAYLSNLKTHIPSINHNIFSLIEAKKELFRCGIKPYGGKNQ